MVSPERPWPFPHRRSRPRWLIPAGIAAAVVVAAFGAGVVGSILAADQDTDSPNGAAGAGARFATVEDLREAVQDAGVDCTDWEVVDSPTDATQRAACTSTVVLSIHTDAAQVTASVQAIAALTTGDLDRVSVHLTGPNWSVNCSNDEDLCRDLQEAIGGSVRIAEPDGQPDAAEPQPAAAPETQVLEGSGDDVVFLDAPLTDVLVVEFACPGCSSNVVLESDGPEGLLVNEIGAYEGRRWINVEGSEPTGQFVVTADAAWTLTVGSVDSLATYSADGRASGRGDDVLLLIGDYRALAVTHQGESNFVVHGYNLDDGEGGLLVNEIGRYEGTVPLDGPALVQVTADGQWAIDPAG